MLSRHTPWVAVFLMLAFVSPLRAEQVFTALLTGDQEVPPNVSTAGAIAKLTLSDDASTIRLSFVYEGINAADLTGAHIHDAPATVSGPIVVNVGPSASPRINFSAPMPAGQLDDLLAGEWYLNLHTTAFPNGEIRAQFTPSTSVAYARLNGLEEVPPNNTRGQGFGRIDFAVPGGTVGFASIRLFTLATPVVGAHIHGRGFPFQNAGILFDLGAADASGVVGDTFVSLDTTDLNAGLYYFNVHTSAFPGGQIRGQIVRSPGIAYIAALDGLQTVPPNASTATGQGIVVFYDLSSPGRLSLRFAGLASNNTASGLYDGPRGTNGGEFWPIGSTGAADGTFVGVNVPIDHPVLPNLDQFLASGRAYLSVSSQTFPAGEIRGQLGRFDFIHSGEFE